MEEAVAIKAAPPWPIVRILPWRRIVRSPEDLARVEGVAHAFADEDQERQHGRDGEERGQPEPPRGDLALAFVEQLAERGRAGRQAEAEEVERRERAHRARQD